MPSELAASNWPLLIDWMPARKISARYAELFMASTATAVMLSSTRNPAIRSPMNATKICRNSGVPRMTLM